MRLKAKKTKMERKKKARIEKEKKESRLRLKLIILFQELIILLTVEHLIQYCTRSHGIIIIVMAVDKRK